MSSLDDDSINGELRLPGVWSDIVAHRGAYVSIYGWSGDKTGRTRAALHSLRAYAPHIEVHDPDEPGTSSHNYWTKMVREGLVDELHMGDGTRVKRPDPEQHRCDLNNVFIFAGQVAGAGSDDLRRVANLHLQHALGQCENHIAMKTPCGAFQGSVAAQFLRRQDWARHEPYTSLWAQYVDAGLIESCGLVPFHEVVESLNANDPVDRTSVGLIHPLEAAVLNGNIDTLAALMEAGADEAAVPTRDWSWSRKGPIEDILGFIWARVPNPAFGPLMVAKVTEVVMRRRIEQAGKPAPGVEPSLPRRTGRRL